MMNFETLAEKLVDPIKKSVTTIPQPTVKALKKAKDEADEGGKVQLEAMLKAINVGGKEEIPICQDTGVPTFFITVGHSFPAINEIGKLKSSLTSAVRKATEEVPLRPNTVHPITEENPGDNTGRNIPYIEWNITTGKNLKITYLPKGGGSENMSQLTMMTPGKGLKGVKEIVLDRIASMEGKPCPPTTVGVGLGGGANIAMNLAKEAILRPIGERHEEEKIANLERELLEKANELGVGPMGVGGKPTVLDIKIDYAHRHPASFPVGIIPQCWANRRVTVTVNPDGSVEVVD
ncbi:fumarate hydratase [candidate division MSBL1 archaeon SCGC-AAA382A13]|uniref:Fumarate hydratase n=1 Tax=candidate division MSBL1 archaeon SCGC-AAA382A13 TaxID=1698279 RepID=A0A133VFW0_9EURY|nr:fumarate hydratase [candidate division MSBL1 archaeon SCGC-AAA382A13]